MFDCRTFKLGPALVQASGYYAGCWRSSLWMASSWLVIIVIKGIQAVKFSSGLLGAEPPIDGDSGRVAFLSQGVDFSPQVILGQEGRVSGWRISIESKSYCQVLRGLIRDANFWTAAGLWEAHP